MKPVSSHGGEMSQDVPTPVVHPKAVDPATRRGRGLYHGLQSSSVGLEMGLSVLIGLLAGWWLDDTFGTSPWLMLLFIGFGLAAGFRAVLRAVAKEDRRAAREAQHG
jgi:ATP synthase protein I